MSGMMAGVFNSLREHPSVLRRFDVENAGSYIFLLPDAGFALAINVPDGLGERFEDIRSFFGKYIVYVMCGHDI